MRKGDDHQQVLNVRIKHCCKLILSHVWNGMDEIQNGASYSIVGLCLFGEYVLDVLKHLIKQLQQLSAGFGYLSQVHQRFNLLGSCSHSFLSQLQCNDFWLVADCLNFDWSEHTSRLSLWNAKWNTNISLHAHSSSLKGSVEGQMNWVAALTGIILVNDGAVIGDFITSCPPA